MAEKQSRKGKALYSDSPTLKRGEDGAVKPTKPSAKKPEAKAEGKPMHGRHAKEMADMHKRHAEEMAAMHKRHEEEAAE